jgi:hypothetical protein
MLMLNGQTMRRNINVDYGTPQSSNTNLSKFCFTHTKTKCKCFSINECNCTLHLHHCHGQSVQYTRWMRHYNVNHWDAGRQHWHSTGQWITPSVYTKLLNYSDGAPSGSKLTRVKHTSVKRNTHTQRKEDTHKGTEQTSLRPDRNNSRRTLKRIEGRIWFN